MASKVVIFVVAGLLVVGACIGIGYVTGYFTHPCKTSEHAHAVTNNHAPGPCQLVDGIDVGSEDIVVLSSGLALITSGMTSFLPPDKEDLLSRTGTLKMLDMNDVGAGAADIPIVNQGNFNYEEFNPHGIAVWNDKTSGRIFVFVVNHNHAPDLIESIEKFEFDADAKELTHLQKIRSDESFLMLNNLVATGPDTFYFTNLLSSGEPKEMARQLKLRTKTASIGYYDGQQGRLVVEGLRGANGITISPDGNYIYIGMWGDESFVTFKRDGNNDLTLYKTYPLHTGVDNLDGTDGDYVWIGCHPDHAKALEYISDPDVNQSPSQALRLLVLNGELKETTEVYMNDGSQFSGCTVAVNWNNKILLGSVFTKALYCDANYIG